MTSELVDHVWETANLLLKQRGYAITINKPEVAVTIEALEILRTALVELDKRNRSAQVGSD